MKLLFIFTAVVSAIYSLPFIKNSFHPYWSQTRLEGGHQDSLNFSDRFVRGNADNLKAPLERLQRIARITNGIHLLNELIAGTIPVDELISELLFFEPVPSSEITKLDEEAIVTAIETLKNLPDNLKASTEASNAETSFDKLSELLNKIEGIGNLKEWDKDKQHFKDEIEKLKKYGINTTDSKRLLRTALDWTDNYDILNEGTKADLSVFNKIKKALEDLQTTINTFDSSGIHWTFDKFDTLMTGLSPITKAADGVLFLNPILAKLEITEDYKTAYSNFLDEASSKISSIIKVDPGLQAIQKLVTAKETKSRQRTLKHTHGFPRGMIDLKEAKYDIGDPWIRKIVKTVALKAAFNKLEELETLLSKSDNSLDFKKQEVVSIDGLLKNVASVSYIFTNIENVKSGLNQAVKCNRPFPKDVASTNFDELKNKLKEMDEKLEQLNKKTTELSSHLKKEGLDKMCEGLIRICEDAQKASNIQDSVGKFKSYEKLGELDKVFKKLQSISNKISSELYLDTLKTDAGIVLANFSTLDSYHTGLNHYSDYFNCLQNDNNLKLVLKIDTEIKKTRQFKSDNTYIPSLNKGLEVVKKVTSVKQDLENSKSELDKLRGFNSSETKELDVFKNTGELSKVIGEAVQGVANMKNALDKRTETVEKVLNNIQFVRSNQKLLTDPTDVKNLQDLIRLESSIQSMYSTLDTFIGGVKDNDSPVLKNHSDLFKSAKLVTGVSGDFLAMSSSVENLKTKIPGSKNLEELQSSLKTMETMGLDFAKYKGSFDNSDSSLGDLDVAFANYNKRMARKTPSPPAQQQGAQQASQGPSNKKSEKKDDSTLKIALTATLASVIFFGTSSVSGYFFVWRPWKKRRNIKKFLDDLMRQLGLCHLNADLTMVFAKKPALEMIHFWKKSYGIDTLNIQRPEVEKKCTNVDCVEHTGKYNPTTMVELNGDEKFLKNKFYHAHVIPITKKKKVILSTTPVTEDGKPQMIAKYFWIAKTYGCKTIFLLDKGVCGKDPHVPQKKGADLTCNDVYIKCLEMETISDKVKYPKLTGVIEKRKLEIKFENHEPFIIDHVWYIDWDTGCTPVSTYDLVYILNMIEKEKTPPLITSAGLAHAECLCFILFARTMIHKKSGLSLKNVFEELTQNYYSEIIQTYTLYQVTVLALYEFLTQSEKIKVEDCTKEQYEKFKKFCPGHDEAKKTYMKNYTDDLAIKDPEPEEGQKAGTTSKTTDTLNGIISTQSAEPPQP